MRASNLVGKMRDKTKEVTFDGKRMMKLLTIISALRLSGTGFAISTGPRFDNDDGLFFEEFFD